MIMTENTLAAVPLFIFMGILMEQAGLMERLFNAVQLMLSKTRGALFYAVMFVSTIFAAATGIVGASVTILGIMAGKTMIGTGYDTRLSAGLICAGGTLGILIPSKHYVSCYGSCIRNTSYRFIRSSNYPRNSFSIFVCRLHNVKMFLNPKLGPVLPASERPKNMAKVWYEFLMGLIPPAGLVFFALGSILFGLATPTEGAGMGAFGAILLALAYKKLTYLGLKEALLKTLEITALIMFLVAASNFFGAVFSKLGTPSLLTDFLLNLDVNKYVILAIIMAAIFLLGWPLEWVPIVLIVLPIVLPLILELGFNLTWFAILVAVNLQTAWLSPPVALSAYFLKGVVPQWDLKDIYLGMMQFMVIQLIGLILIIIFPQIALWLPSIMYPSP